MTEQYASLVYAKSFLILCICFIICVLAAVEMISFKSQESLQATTDFGGLRKKHTLDNIRIRFFSINQFHKVGRDPVTPRAHKYERNLGNTINMLL